VTDVRSYLELREKELGEQIANLRAQMAPLERELFEVKIAQRAVSRQSREPLQQHLFAATPDAEAPEAKKVWEQYLRIQARQLNSP
jgi:hypothetical protein